MTADDERTAWRAASLEVSQRVVRSFDALARWLRLPTEALAQRPTSDAWSPLEILEHVALANHYLLILAEKIRDKSRARVERGESWPTAPPRLEHLAAIAEDRRVWAHPEHMTPGGRKDPSAIKGELAVQRARCTALLSEMPEGEGTLHRIRISVLEEGDDRLDLVQMIDFLARHAERHLKQIERSLA